MRVTRSPLAILSLCAFTGSAALAYTLSGSRWFEPSATFHVGIAGTSPSGVPWSSALRSAMQDWNAATTFDFVADETYLDPCVGLRRNDGTDGTGVPLGPGDSRNGMDFRANLCGNNFGAGVLAITMSLARGGPLGFPVLDQTDIVFNSNYQWDVYQGPAQSTRIDFRRVALHELGHALGLDHSSDSSAIMAANYGAVHALQTDDINGANALYGTGGTCQVRDVSTSARINDRLGVGDCRVRDLFGSSDDTSFVDVYRLTLTRTTQLDILVQSSELDPVLILTNANLGGIEIHDDTDGSCDARLRKSLPAGEYRILVNTYEAPTKCAGNVGTYSLTLSDSGIPLLGSIRNASGGVGLANAVINGGATADAGATYRDSFGADQAFDVIGTIAPDPAHVGRAGRLYVLAVLDDGRRFVQNGSGVFVPFTGAFSELVPRRTGVLLAQEYMPIAFGLRGSTSGLSGHQVAVYLGYALDGNPAEIWYGGSPIRFTVAPQ